MDYIVTLNGRTILKSINATAIPRSGDFLLVTGNVYKVKRVVWHMDSRTWVEVQVEYGGM